MSQTQLFDALSDASPDSRARRDFMVRALIAGGSLTFGVPSLAASSSDHTHDWQWLVGNWDVFHRRLKERLAGNNEWEEFSGASALWLTLGGLGTIDDNMLHLPAGDYRGLTVRTFDSTTQQWSIWWVDGRNPTSIDPPVLGKFDGDHGTFIGRDTFKGTPIVVRFRWQDIHSKRPWWEQAFSTDEGSTWEVNWRNYFTRTASVPTPFANLPDAPKDFDFLVGRWKVRHRVLEKRLAGRNDWQEFNGTLVNWPVLGGHGSVSDNVMDFPSGTLRGLGLQVFDPSTRMWSDWWLDGKQPSVLATPLRGRFENGVGLFTGEETVDGRPVRTRAQWSAITAQSARWEQSSSVDGITWETNWRSEFTRS